jgi:uncharacterized membrane protein HdeD (DUF308 family)
MSTSPSATPWTATDSVADPTELLKRTRRWLMVAGVLSLLGGIAAILLPNVASVATAVLVGWLLILTSAMYVVDAFSTRDGTRIALRLLMAVLSFAAGLYLLVAPLDGTFTLTVVLVIWFVAIGIARLVTGTANRGTPESGMLMLNGALSLALGLLIALGLPESSTWAIGLLVGIDLVFTGFGLITLAQRLRAVTP